MGRESTVGTSAEGTQATDEAVGAVVDEGSGAAWGRGTFLARADCSLS